jgi:Calcineurin-like phosphoesterase
VDGKPAVRWLSIPQLVRTALEIRKVTAYATQTDPRADFAGHPCEFYRLTGRDGDVRVDFAADTGDGYDTALATALCLARDGDTVVTPPRAGEDAGDGVVADLLVLGGDLVYPVASATRYEERFTSVFRQAAELAEMRPDKPPLVALPGNHDWYDGLKSFSDMMCSSWRHRDHTQEPNRLPVPPPADRADVGGWGAFQSRSYFAVQLTDDWWLWGVDSQLDAPIDEPQVAYFEKAADLLDSGTNIILCTATPSWLEAADLEPDRTMRGTPFDNLLTFVDRVLGERRRDQIRLLLTGDKHHYARYEPEEDAEFRADLVTCGGGGAFLSSTHHLPRRLNPFWPRQSASGDGGHALHRSYPTAAESKELVATPKFLAAGIRNGLSLPTLAGIVGVLLCVTFHFGLIASVIGGVALAGLFGFYANYGKNQRAPRVWVGFALAVGHAIGHLGAAGLVAWFFARVLPVDFWWSLFPAFLVLAVLGTIVFTTYLHLADGIGWHVLEAFSGMRFESYKCHLRMEIGKNGIHVRVVGMDSAPPPNRGRTTITRPAPRIIDEFDVSMVRT